MATMTTHTPALIALDWGTSNLRAALLNTQGEVLQLRGAASGVMAVQAGHFEDALLALCGDWIDTAPLPLLASGMVGSRMGWREVPYLACPAGAEQAAAALLPVPLQQRPGRQVHLVPGLRCVGPGGAVDVMRGEETQSWGAGLNGPGLCLLPGTHSKWAQVDDAGRISHFSTYMTGELFAVLTQHSILGRLMQGQAADDAAFDAGVRRGLAEHAHLSHALFGVRTAGLEGQFAPEALADHLSGLLIGAELGSALPGHAGAEPVLLGEPALCSRYARALALAGHRSHSAPAQATFLGLWRLAQAAGLLRH